MLIEATSKSEPMEVTYQRSQGGKPWPAVMGYHGPRLATFSTAINPAELEGVLGHDPRSKNRKEMRDKRVAAVYDHIQRKTPKERSEQIKAYITDRIFESLPIAGAFPAISIAIEQTVEFKSENNSIAGIMTLPTSRMTARIVLDGLGRITPLLDMIDDIQSLELSSEEVEEISNFMNQFDIPVVFFAPQPGTGPLTQKEMEQLFADFNFRARPVSEKDAMALDHTDPYVLVTKALAEKSKLSEHKGMAVKRASVGANDPQLVAQPVLMRFVRAALDGIKGAEKARNVVDKDAATAAKKYEALLVTFLDEFAAAMGSRWSDRSSMHLSSPGWQVLGLLFHDVVVVLGKGEGDIKKFAGAIARLDWRRNGELFSSIMEVRKGKDGSDELVMNRAGATVRRDLHKAIREKLGLNELLASAQTEA